MNKSNYILNLLIMTSCLGPAALLLAGQFENVDLIAISMAGVALLTFVASIILMKRIKKEESFLVPVSPFKDVAARELSKLELGGVWIFPSEHAWKISDHQWRLATNSFGLTVNAAFEATKNLPYLLFGFLCLMSLYIGLTGDFGPSFRLFINKEVGGWFAQVVATLTSSWAASGFLLLGSNRLIFRLMRRRLI
ncbi:hypothetical protein [Variovorax sp. PBL-H6]|uniref:hypothetical protein n=1 Tax=Variovorax sp. PBL-H6 TaxID=434009 RepID=UPI0013A53C21|nr:hypothetical protein [Variovorax sp. PBL-H6]